jgi:hypothetical protein
LLFVEYFPKEIAEGEKGRMRARAFGRHVNREKDLVQDNLLFVERVQWASRIGLIESGLSSNGIGPLI